MFLLCVFTTGALAYGVQSIHFIESKSLDCNRVIDSLFDYVVKFEPTEIRIDKSIKKDKILNSLLNRADMMCFKQDEKKSKYIVAIILLKQYLFHLKCCNQSYDLLSMKEGNAQKIIDYFLLMTQQNEYNIEVLSSQKIVQYAYHDGYLCGVASINEVLIDIAKQEK